MPAPEAQQHVQEEETLTPEDKIFASLDPCCPQFHTPSQDTPPVELTSFGHVLLSSIVIRTKETRCALW